MKKIVLAVIVLFVFVAGCGDYGIVVRPDVYVSGNFAPPYYGYYSYYGPFWEYSVLTTINGSTYELEVIQDGVVIKGKILPEEPLRLLPGKSLRLLIKNYYNESRQVSMIAVAYSGNRFIGVATRTFHFYGSTYNRQSKTWKITNRNIRDP